MLSHLTALYKEILKTYEKLLAFEYIFKLKENIEKNLFKYCIHYTGYSKLYNGYRAEKPP